MKPQSAKNKGRKLQKIVRDDLREIGRPYGLEDGDVESRGMGQNGVDVILSPAAKRLFNLAIECKNCETLNVARIFQEHYKKYAQDEALKLLVHSKNHTDPMVTLKWQDFLRIMLTLVTNEQTRKIGFRSKK